MSMMMTLLTFLINANVSIHPKGRKRKKGGIFGRKRKDSAVSLSSCVKEAMADQDQGYSSGESCCVHTAEPEFVEMDVTGRYGRYNDILGKGAFKTVYRAFDEVDGIEVAWNQVKIHDLLQSPEELERLYSEVHLLRSLKHKNIIKFYTSWVDVKNKNVNFITEIFNSGTLRQYRKKHKHVDIKAVKNWARQILRGLLYLHSHDPPIIHRDLKCDNIFVNGNNGEVKIGDLGLATILRQAHAAHSVIGTPEFMAPELYEEEYNELVDIYSFGMCLLELVTFEYPYSECTNAAQIYKKVTSGKKPAALERVKDLDVRKFIENCLAVASKRLPARELLSDPFLQNEMSKEQPECSQPPRKLLIPHVLLGRDEFSEPSIKEEPGRHDHIEELLANVSAIAHHEPSDLKNDIHLESTCSKDQTSNEECKLLTEPSTFSKDEEPLRILDFRVKGRKRDDNTVSLRLRIVNIQGHVRHIHFLFDVEGDTAISVASEMVEELQLSDQDVTTIAEMIDAKILALVPEWNPAASFEEPSPETEEHNQNTVTPDSKCEKSKNENGVDFVKEIETSETPNICPSLLRPSACDASLARGEGMMHGRFEEVTYNQGSSDYSPSSSGAPPLVSQNCFDHRVYGESVYNDVDRTCSPDFETFEPSVWLMLNESPDDMHKDSQTDSQNVKDVGCAFNELVECQRNAGGSKYTHQSWERIMNLATCSDEQVNYTTSEREGSGKGLNVESLWSAGGSDPITPTELTDGEEDFDQELKLLALEQEREVLELRKKHEKAILEAKTRRERKSGMTTPSNPIKDGPQSSFLLPYDVTDSSMSDSDSHKCLGGGISGVNQDCSSSHLETKSQLSTGKGYPLSRRSTHSERISLNELAAMTNSRVDDDTSINSQQSSLLNSQISTIFEIEKCTSIMQANRGQQIPENLSMASIKTALLSDKIMDRVEGGASHQGCFVDDNKGDPYGRNLGSVEVKMNKTNPYALEGMCNVCKMDYASAIIYSTNPQEQKDLQSEMNKSRCYALKSSCTVCDGDYAPATIHPTDPETFNEFRTTEDGSCSKINTSDSYALESLCTFHDIEDATIHPTNPNICNEFRVIESESYALEGLHIIHNTDNTISTIHPKNPTICNEFQASDLKCSDVLKLNDIQTVEAMNAQVSVNEVSMVLESSSKLTTRDSDTLLQLKKEQLQRSIAELEAKTLEGLEHGLMANRTANGKPTCSSSRYATNGLASQSQPNSASESKKN